MTPVHQRNPIGLPPRAAVPRLRRDLLVERPRLLERLTASAQEPAVLIVAGAGYGKTTLAAQWLAVDPRPSAWLSLEPGGDDAAEVFRSIALALEAAGAIAPSLTAGLGVPGQPLGRRVIPEIASALAEGPGVVLVLDDYHVVRSTQTHEAVAALVEWIPERCQVAITARADPLLPVGRWRARGQLVEIRAADLAFAPAEAAAMLAAAGVELGAEDVDSLVERTDGWAAGLSLAAPLLRGAENPSLAVRRFAGDHRHVVAYLAGEVLTGLTRAGREFMLHTGILRRLSGGVCDAVVGRRGSDEELRRLVGANLFLIPLDDPGWYRYHHLLAELLVAELRRTAPGLEPELHRRAAAWHAEHGDPEEAVHHAIAAEDWAGAAALAARAWPAMIALGRIEPFLAWLERIPEPAVAAFPPLAVGASQASMLTGQTDRALGMLDLAEGSGWEGSTPLGTTTLESAIAAVRARIGPNGASGIRRDAERVLQLEPPGSPGRPIAHAMRGLALMLQGDDAGGRAEIAQALAGWGDTTPNPSLAALAMGGLMAQRLGDPETADRETDEARRRADELGLSDAPPTALIALSRAHVLAESRRLPDGVIEAEDALRLGSGAGTVTWAQILMRAVVAPVLALGGQGERAEALLDEGAALAAAWPDPGILPAWLAESRDRVRAARHDAVEHTLHTREREILALLPTDLTMREIGRRLYLSVNTIKTYNLSLFRKLGATSRAEAVERARGLGLLGPEASAARPR